MKAISVLFAFVAFLSVLPIFKPVFAADILINEFIPNPGTGNSEWVEFYNTTGSTIDLSDYFFDDDTNFDSDSGSSAKVALSGLLPSVQTCFQDLSSYLNNNGDSPALFKVGNTTPLDTYTYSSSSAGLSYLRIPDGGDWNINQIPSKSSNRCTDLAPTPTSTPIPTSSSSNTPTPTKTPTPSKTPTPKPTLSVSKAVSPTKPTPDSVLGEATKSALPTKAEEKGDVKTESLSSKPDNLIGKIFIFLGVVFLLACAIVIAYPFIARFKREKLDG